MSKQGGISLYPAECSDYKKLLIDLKNIFRGQRNQHLVLHDAGRTTLQYSVFDSSHDARAGKCVVLNPDDACYNTVRVSIIFLLLFRSVKILFNNFGNSWTKEQHQ